MAKIASIHLFLSMAAMKNYIKNAFLHGDLEEEICIEQPPGFVARRESSLGCRLQKSLYGLKQSPRAWFGRFNKVLQQFGMVRSEADHLVFYKHSSCGCYIYLVIYVDDIVNTGDDREGIKGLKQLYIFKLRTWAYCDIS